MPMPKINFCLNTIQTKDEQTKGWVGYIPGLRLYTQAATEEGLKEALRETAFSFIGLCWHRKILDKVMLDRGMRRSTPEVIQKAIEAKKQYIVVGMEIEQDVQEAYGEVPIALLAGKQGQIECLH